MAFGREIAQAEVGLRINDAELASDLAAAQARVRRTMAAIDREEATAKVSANLKPLQKDLQQAEAMVEAWEKRVDAAQTKHQRYYRRRQLENAKAASATARAALEGQQSVIEATRATNRELALQDKRYKAIETHERRVSALRRRALQQEQQRLKLMERDRTPSLLEKWARSLTNVTVRLGPFTASIKQLSIALLVLGPVLTGIVGSLGALIGVAGAGLIGALGVGAAGLTGFALAAGGIALVMKPLVGDLQAAKAASENYHKAVLRYGKESKEAAKAQEKLQQTLKGVSPAARKAFEDFGALSGMWRKLTKESREPIFETAAEGIRTMQKLMPDFAKRTNEATKSVGEGMQKWMQGLRGARGRSVLDNIFGNFNRQLPGLMRSLGLLGGAFGRVAEAFSRNSALGQVVRGFERWSRGVNKAANDTQRMNHIADKSTDAFRSLTGLLGATGRVVGQFFRAGIGPGMGLMDRMTGSLTRLSEAMSTPEGQRGLASFFQSAIETGDKLMGVLRPLMRMFAEFVTIMRPFSNIFLDVAGAATKLAAGFLQLGPVKVLLQGLFAAALVRNVMRLAGAFKFLGSALAVAGGFKGLGTLAAGAGLGRLAGGATKAAKSSGALGKALGGVGLGAVRLNPWIAGLSTMAVLFSLNKSKAEQLSQAFDDAGKNADAAREGYNGTARSLADLASEHAHNRVFLRQARKDLKDTKKGTDEYRLALQNVRDMERQTRASGSALNTVRRNMAATANAEVKSEAERLGMFRARHADDRKQLELTAKQGLTAGARAHAQERLNALAEKEAPLIRAVEAALQKQAVAQINVARGLAGLNPILGQAERRLGALARVRPNLAAKIGITFPNASEAGRVAQSASQALARGASLKAVLRIIADNKDAKAAITELNNLKMKEKRVEVIAGILSALGGIKRVNAMQVAVKVLTIISVVSHALGGWKTVNKLGNIFRWLTVLGNNSMARTAYAAIAGLGNIYRTLFITEKRKPSGNAEGGVIDRAAARAAHAPTRDMRSGGKVRQPTFITGEEDKTEFVIATNPAYRARNRRLLAEAAGQLGMRIEAARAGRRPTKSEKKALRKNTAALPVPEAVHYGAVSDDEMEKGVDAARGRYQKRDRRVMALTRKIDDKGKKIQRLKDPKAKRRASNDLADMRRERDGLISGNWPGAKNSLSDLYIKWQTMGSQLRDLRKTNRTIERLDIEAESARKQMETASKRGDTGGYNAAFARREELLGRLVRHYQTAMGLAKDPKMKADLESKFEDLRGQGVDLYSDGSVDDFIDKLGFRDAFDKLRLGLSMAESDSIVGNEATPKAALHGFIKDTLIPGLQGQGVKPGVLAEAFDLLGQYKADEITGPGAGSEDAAIMDQLRTRLRIAQTDRDVNAAYASVAGGPGDIGRGAWSGRAAASQTVIIQALHPADPSVYRAIGDAAATGFGYQGGVNSPRHGVGL